VRYSSFALLGQEFGAMDSAREHKFAFNEAISFIVPCETQGEIDYFLGKAFRRSARRAVWLAQGQVRPLLADHPHDYERDACRHG
jgi:predicted 3-demethylubiquinone-9 3-methyltransferase (glyoxalase superfamily)